MASGRRQRREAWPDLSASSPSEDVLMGNYLVLRDIGRGGFGQVKLARHILTGTEVAVKALPSHRDVSLIGGEIAIMRAVEHPHIVQLFEVIDTADFTYLVMEHLSGGPLVDYVRAAGRLREEEARRVFRQVVCAVCYLHRRGILHRDLKPHNILLDSEGNAKLIDFGLSCRFKPGQKRRAIRGTPAYCAPEVYMGRGYGPEVDLWSLGVVLFFMLVGSVPFTGASVDELQENARRGRYRVPPHINSQPRYLISRLLTVNTDERATMNQLVRHPWLQPGKERAPPPRELFPRRPDPAILRLMRYVGYDPHETWKSVLKRTCDNAMATYLLIRHHVRHGAGGTFQAGPEVRCVAPPPSPADPPAFPLPPKRPASQPNLRAFRPLSSKEDTQSRQKGRRHSLPAIPLSCPPTRTPTPSAAPQASTRQPHREPASSARGDRKSWRRVTGRIVTRIINTCCCCCVLAPRANRVAPETGGQRRPGPFNNRIAPQRPGA